MADAVNAVRSKSMSEREAVRTLKVIQFSFIVQIYYAMSPFHVNFKQCDLLQMYRM